MLIRMPESKAVIGLKWEPKLPALPFRPKASSKSQNQPQSNALWKPNRLMILQSLKELLRKQIKDAAGTAWFDMPAPTVTPELKKDLQLLKLRGAIDPKRHYKTDSKSLAPPRYFLEGIVVESVADYFSGRMTKKERKPTRADELLSDPTVRQYRKRNVREIEERNQPAGNDKWKIKGRKTLKQAKQRRH